MMYCFFCSHIQFLTQHVIYIVAEDYSKWLEHHTLAYNALKLTKTAGPATVAPHSKPHVTF